MNTFNTRSRFETEGVFWNPQKPQSTFSAHLSSAKHVELRLSAEKAGPERLFLNQDAQSSALEHVVGDTTMGACTLIRLHELPPERLLNCGTAQVVFSRLFRADICVMGCHLESDKAPLLSSGSFTYSGVEKWFPGMIEPKITDEVITFSYPRQSPAAIDFCLPCIKSRIKLTVEPEGRFSGKRVTVQTQPRIKIEPREPCSLWWLIDVAWRFETFFSLCLGTSVQLRDLFLETSAGQTGWLIAHRKHLRLEKPDIQAWIKCDWSRLAGAIATWFELSEVFRPTENLIYSAIRASSPVAEMEFLSLAQALESFHRLTDSSTTVSPDSFKQIFAELQQITIERYQKSPIVTRLLEAIRYSNGLSFRRRIELLLERISKSNAEKLMGDLLIFEQTLRQTRNYFTHPGIKKQSRVLIEAPELFLFNQKLHAFLRLIMLIHLGFPETLVFDAVYRQSQKWTVS